MMRRIYILLLLVVLPLMAAVPGNKSYSKRQAPAPLYIVDGKVGVGPQDLPPAEDVASMTQLSGKEAVDLYGKRAAGGVIIIRTKDFEKDHVLDSRTNAKRKKSGDAPNKLVRFARKIAGGNNVLETIILIVVVVPLMTIPLYATPLITKLRKRFRKRTGRKSAYYPGTFDAGGEVFRATSSPWYYLVLALLLGLTVYLAVVMYRMLVRQTFTFSVLSVVLLILLAAVFVYLICRVHVELQKRKSYLIIDKEGIRGIYVKAHRFPVKPQFRNVNIRWDELTDVKVSCEYNTYLDFYYKRAQLPYKSIYLEYLPTRKVIDCINFFYARHAGITKQPALIKPTPFELTNTFTFLLISLGVLVLCYLVY